MKNFNKIALCFLMLTLSNFISAQEYDINFVRDANWKSIAKMAKKQNKPIFVDCYTSWCGPCKKLAKEVFTQKEVAEFYNENFISVSMDMEKGEGIKLKTEWKVKAFPTLLYFDKNGEIVHRVVGAYDAGEFLAYSKMALDENKMSSNLQKRYDAGERSPAFMYDYLVSLRLGYQEELEKRISNDYLSSLSNEDLLKKENWNIIKNFMKDPSTKGFQYLVTNREKLAAINGSEEVEKKLFKTIENQIQEWSFWYKDSKNPFETEKEDNLLGFLQLTNYDKAPILLAKLLANKYKRLEDSDQYLTTLDYIIKLNLVGDSGTIVSYANNVIGSYKSEKALAKALTWLNIADKKENRIEHRAAILTAKSKVLEKLGNKTDAELTLLAAQKADKEAEDAGTKIHTVPMMTMTAK